MGVTSRAEKSSLSSLISGGQGLRLSQWTRTEDLVGLSLWLPSAALWGPRGGSVPRSEERHPTVAASLDPRSQPQRPRLRGAGPSCPFTAELAAQWRTPGDV